MLMAAPINKAKWVNFTLSSVPLMVMVAVSLVNVDRQLELVQDPVEPLEQLLLHVRLLLLELLAPGDLLSKTTNLLAYLQGEPDPGHVDAEVLAQGLDLS